MTMLLTGLAVAAILLLFGLMCLSARTWTTLAINAVVLTVYCSGWLGLAMPTRFPLILLLLVVVAGSKRLRGDHRGWILLTSFALVTVLLAASSSVGWVTWWSPQAGEKIVRYLLLFPSAWWVGKELMDRNSEMFRTVYVAWSVVLGALAAIEYFVDRPLTERPDLKYDIARSGHVRATLLAEHPLVLATLLALAVPMAMRAEGLGRKTLYVVPVLAGIYATQSRGPLAVALVYIAFRAAFPPKPHRNVAAKSLVLPVLVVVAVASAVALLSEPAVASGRVVSSDPAQASLEYRLALYQRVGDSLSTHPFGWGPNGLPAGVYLLDSSAFGTLDLANTIDSEPVLLVLEYGIVGLIVFLLIVAMTFDRILRVSGWVADSMGVLLLCSTFLAIHAWTGLGTMAFILLAATLNSQGHTAQQSRLPRSQESSTERRSRPTWRPDPPAQPRGAEALTSPHTDQPRGQGRRAGQPRQR